MRNTPLRIFAASAVFFLLSIPIFAHHGNASYDLGKTITLGGSVTGFDWENPHCLIHLDVTDQNGKIQQWTIEMAAPFTMQRKGWTKDSLKFGDHISLDTHPARNGLSLGVSGSSNYILKVVANGQSLPT